tara:strand:+ start:22 stop:669 length:648 start_codon:yes stop_codon:yes gene_type:complete
MNKIKNLILEIIAYLEKKKLNADENQICKDLKNLQLSNVNYRNLKANNPPFKKSLFKALDTVKENSLIPIKESIYSSLNSLKWNIDNGSYYEKDCDIGNDYLMGNMNTELIGPKNGHFISTELKLGLFLLEPNIFYKDHKHEAPELYLNLTPETEWRFNNCKWENKAPGSIVYNEPYKVHAMKIKDIPFLSIWCWPKNSSKKCMLVPRNDWKELE